MQHLVTCGRPLLSRHSWRSSKALFSVMTPARSSTSHEERTATEPRGSGIESVVLRQIKQVNDNIRLMRLYASSTDRAIKVSHHFALGYG